MGPASAMQRLMEFQDQPASPGLSSAEIARLLEDAAAAELQLQQAGQAEQAQRALAFGPGVSEAFDTGGGPHQSLPRPQSPPAADPALLAELEGVEIPSGTDPFTFTGRGGPTSLVRPELGSEVRAAEAQIVAGEGGIPVVRVQGPGEPTAIDLPLSDTPGMINNRLAILASQGTISPIRAEQAFNHWALARRGLATGGPASAGPLTELTTEFSQTQEGPISPENQRRAQQANEAVRAAQAAADAAALEIERQQTEGLSRHGELISDQARQRQAEEDAFQQEVARRVSVFDDSLDAVQNGRVDPEAFFGQGVGTRIGAAIAVALGSLGSTLTGGPNEALSIINNAIERNVRAQERNMANLQVASQMRGSALAQMRSIMDDERGAREAVRALHMQAAIRQIDSQISGARGQHLAGLQQLRSALMEQQNAAAAVAADRARLTARISGTTRARTRSGPGVPGIIQARMGELVTVDAVREYMRQQVEAEAQDRVIESEQGMVPFDNPDLTSSDPATRRAAIRDLALSFATPTPERIRRVREARARLQVSPNDREARDTIVADRAQHVEASRAFARAIRGVPGVSEEEIATNARLIRERALGGAGTPLPATPPPGLRLADGELPDAWQRWQRGTSTEEGERRYNALAATTHAMSALFPRLLETRRRLGGQLTNRQVAATQATALRSLILMELRRANTGAAFTEAETRQWDEMIPDPAGLDPGAWWDGIDNRLAGFQRALLTSLDSQLFVGYGQRVDVAAFGAPELRALGRRGREAIQRARGAREETVEVPLAPPRGRVTEVPTIEIQPGSSGNPPPPETLQRPINLEPTEISLPSSRMAPRGQRSR